MQRGGDSADLVPQFAVGDGVVLRQQPRDGAPVLGDELDGALAEIDDSDYFGIVNLDEQKTTVDRVTAANHPQKPELGEREIAIGREVWIEATDFMEDPPKKFFRLAPGREVRLRYGYLVTCTNVVKDAAGNVVELRCTYDPETRGGNTPPDGRKVKSTIHWVSAKHAVAAEVRLYDRLFNVEAPGKFEVSDAGTMLAQAKA